METERLHHAMLFRFDGCIFIYTLCACVCMCVCLSCTCHRDGRGVGLPFVMSLHVSDVLVNSKPIGVSAERGVCVVSVTDVVSTRWRRR